MKPLILITNDDGLQSKGIAELIEMARPLGEVLVIAPNGPRSANSSAISMELPITYKIVRQEPDLTIYECSGTPTDCAKLGFYLHNRMPDFLFSGINHGSNASINVIYSGTMGAVMEGCVQGVPSVGFSLCDHATDADFSVCVPIFRRIAEKVIAEGLPDGVCLNVNAPTGDIKGVRVCRQAKGFWEKEYEFGVSPFGKTYAWMTGFFSSSETDDSGSDIRANNDGYISVVPTRLDMTDYEAINTLKSYAEIQ